MEYRRCSQTLPRLRANERDANLEYVYERMAAEVQYKVKDKIMRMGGKEKALGDVGKVCPGSQNLSLSVTHRMYVIIVAPPFQDPS